MVGEYVYLEVTDDGAGMDKETLERMFDPFFSTKFTGRGLGLATIQGIVQSHDGWIGVRDAPDKGTSLQVCFPAVQTHERGTSSDAVTMEPFSEKIGENNRG